MEVSDNRDKIISVYLHAPFEFEVKQHYMPE